MIFMTHREFNDLISLIKAVVTRESHITSMWRVRYDWGEGLGRAYTWFQVKVHERCSLWMAVMGAWLTGCGLFPGISMWIKTQRRLDECMTGPKRRRVAALQRLVSDATWGGRSGGLLSLLWIAGSGGGLSSLQDADEPENGWDRDGEGGGKREPRVQQAPLSVKQEGQGKGQPRHQRKP